MSKILEIDISLQDIKPKIWRRVHVPAEFTFRELHYVIQFAMGWTNSHLHQFLFNNRSVGLLSDDGYDDENMEDGSKVPISEALKAPKDKLEYEYDFGDGWEHLIEVKKVLEPEAGKAYPVLIDGAMACPPEDCGGIGGYAHLVEVMKKKKGREYETLLQWLGEDFDPEAFDINEFNEAYFEDFKGTVEDWEEGFF